MSTEIIDEARSAADAYIKGLPSGMPIGEAMLRATYSSGFMSGANLPLQINEKERQDMLFAIAMSIGALEVIKDRMGPGGSKDGIKSVIDKLKELAEPKQLYFNSMNKPKVRVVDTKP